jgi:hypothetical protein
MEGARQGDAGQNGVVVMPFIGSGRRGGGRSRGREAAGGEVSFNPIGFEKFKEREGIRGTSLMMEGEKEAASVRGS